MQINMDTSSASSSCSNNFHHQNNWLAFSLSNNSHQLSLFQSSSLFNPTTSSSDGVELSSNIDQENYGTSCNVEGPKFEDFLGGAGGGSTAALDGGTTVLAVKSNGSNVQMYDDSGLKTIAGGGFLTGFSVEGPPEKAAVAVDPPAKKAAETFGQRTSIYRGVTRHRWTGRYEAHLWDNSCRREGQSRKGRQVYLGGYDKEDKAARAYDLAAIKYWGPTTTTNFPIANYEKEIEEMKHMTRQEFVASLRRKSSGFSRGASMYRGVTRHHQHGRWQARIGRVAGNKDLYLGTFSTQEEAAEAYDIAAIKFRGLNAVTNFDMSRYDVKSIASSNLPIGGVNNKSKTSSDSNTSDNNNNNNIDGNIQTLEDNNTKDFSSATSGPYPNPTINSTVPVKQDNFWAALGYSQNPTINAKDIMKQDQSTPNFWAALGYNQNPNCDAGAASFNVEFQVNGEGYYNNGGGCCYYQQQAGNGTNNSSSSASVLTENAVNNNGTTPHDASGYVNWLQQHQRNTTTVHTSYQSGKGSNNLSAFQTPIFGIE